MKRIALVVVAVLLVSCVVSGTQARVYRESLDALYVPGRLDILDGHVMCHCFDFTGTCTCVFFSKVRGDRAYQELMMLDSFEGEDEDYLYFSAAIKENTNPPIFDITARGDARVKVSKEDLRQLLMRDEQFGLE